MESPSNLRSLTAMLQLKKSQDAGAVAELTSTELQKLGADLQRQSSAVLTTTAMSITQSAAKEMQHFEQQISPELDKIREDLTQRLEQMQQQINQQLQPLDSEAMKKRMGQIQGQINAQTKPLLAALSMVKTESEALASMTARLWLKPVLITLSVLLSISVPAWGLIAYLSSELQNNLVLIQQQERALQQIEAKTWGVQFQEDSSGQFLILPTGTRPETGYQVGKRQAVKLLKK